MTRNIQIDFLRFIAISLVILRHSATLRGSNPLTKGYNFLITGGWVGVDLFFVISGYLITTLIITEYKSYGSFDIKRFLIRRGLKIYPLYYFFLISSYLYSYYALGVTESGRNFLFECLFIGNYFSLNHGHLWSICVEEHFYILISVFFILVTRNKLQLNLIVPLYIVFGLLGLIIRFYNYMVFPSFDPYRDYFYTHIRIDGLLFGSVLAYLSAYRQKSFFSLFDNFFKSIALTIGSFIIITINFFFEIDRYQFISVISLLLNPIAFGIILMQLLSISNKVLLYLMLPFSKIGKYSYAIYLFHVIFLKMQIPGIPNFGIIPFVSRYLLVFIGGIVISKTIEYPIIKIRDKYFPSKYKSLKFAYAP